MKHLAVALGATLLISGCSAELLDFLRPRTSKHYSDPDCTIAVVKPAPMFYVEAPPAASADTPIALEPWALLSAPALQMDVLRPDTFAAEVDAEAQRVTIRGTILRHEANPGADCAFPAIYMVPQVATLSLEVRLPAGKWEVAIASDSFTTEHPSYHPNAKLNEFPGPLATRSILVD